MNSVKIAVMDENITEGKKTAALIRDACGEVRPDDVIIEEFNDCYSFTRTFQEAVFDLLFVAVYGIHDFEAAWKIRDMDKHIPIVIISGDGEYASASWKINITDYLVKPVKPDDIRRSAVRAILKPPEAEANINLTYEDGKKNGRKVN